MKPRAEAGLGVWAKTAKTAKTVKAVAVELHPPFAMDLEGAKLASSQV
jgi:hypothetical protein